MAGDALQSQTRSPDFGPVARQVLEARYLLRDKDGVLIEEPIDMFARVAAAVAAAERPDDRDVVERFEAMMGSLRFLPNSPTLMNAGTKRPQLAACFVLPIEDDMESIFSTLRHMALVQRSGGGTGFSFSRLRPAGAPLDGGGTASGPVGFMKIYDAATANIKQGGKRRGANMAVLHCDHPDIMLFIAAKGDEAVLRNFNVSVAVTDVFMQAVLAGGDHALLHPTSGAVVRTVPAREVFDAIVDAAWRTGDPGLLFLDAIHRADPMQDDEPIEATNPCGEVPLRPYEACTLGSVNLAGFVVDGRLDNTALAETVRDGVRFLDDVVSVNQAPIAAIDDAMRATRKLGLGVMGFAEMLVRLGIPYDTPGAAETGRQVMAAVQDAAHDASRALAEERGVFPAWERSRYATEDDRVRNATCTAIAPTGTIGLIAGTTAGIEPPWALAYRRQGVLDGQDLLEMHPLLEDTLRREGVDVERVLAGVRRTGSLAEADVPDDLARLFVTALDVPVDQHLAIQEAFQKHTDNSVSKTINLPMQATRDDVAHAYRSAWELGLKGITVYRHGSKSQGLFDLGVGDAPQAAEHRPRCDPGECEI